ncbi:hypothetical protein MTP99_010316 [Tenebrio molitor]|nr:hypothetical protein MTP99_010316 [Tenebrio molitor]
MYYADTLTGIIDQFDFDVTNGAICKLIAASLKKHNIEGFPNGMAIDTDGNLKVAVFGGSKVLKIYGSEPEVLLEVVEMLSYEQIWTNSPPGNGATYRVTGVGARGFPGVSVQLN